MLLGRPCSPRRKSADHIITATPAFVGRSPTSAARPSTRVARQTVMSSPSSDLESWYPNEYETSIPVPDHSWPPWAKPEFWAGSTPRGTLILNRRKLTSCHPDVECRLHVHQGTRFATAVKDGAWAKVSNAPIAIRCRMAMLSAASYRADGQKRGVSSGRMRKNALIAWISPPQILNASNVTSALFGP